VQFAPQTKAERRTARLADFECEGHRHCASHSRARGPSIGKVPMPCEGQLGCFGFLSATAVPQAQRLTRVRVEYRSRPLTVQGKLAVTRLIHSTKFAQL
jgi:hypothetical protein